MRTHSFSWIAVMLAVAATTTACGSADGPDPFATPVPGTEVSVVDNAFEPAALQVEVGDTVTWTWEGSNPHDVSFDAEASEIQSSGTWSRTFDEAGEYAYACTVHRGMRGTVVVTEP